MQLIQRRCEVCGGSGLVQKGKYPKKCPQCGGFFPWISWKMFLSANARPGNGGRRMLHCCTADKNATGMQSYSTLTAMTYVRFEPPLLGVNCCSRCSPSWRSCEHKYVGQPQSTVMGACDCHDCCWEATTASVQQCTAWQQCMQGLVLPVLTRTCATA